jgi:hypothetical protein
MQYTPTVPDSFSAIASATDQIDLSWNLGSNADKTYIEWNSAASWSKGSGNFLYNDTGTGTSHSSLNPHTQYFYQAWSWNETDSVYSTSYTADNDTTFNTAPSYGTPSPTNGSTGQPLTLTWSILINDSDGDTFNWDIECSNGQSNSSTGETDGVKELDLTGLDYNTEYTVWVNTTDSYDSVSKWFTFTTGFIPNVIGLHYKWNLISIQINESKSKYDITVSYDGYNYTWNEAVTNVIILNYTYGWKRGAENQSYELADTLQPGYSYWTWSYHNNVNLSFSGDEVGDGYITFLKQKWNLMGLPYNESLDKEDLIIGYNGTDYNWNQATTNNNPEGEPLILGFIYDWDRIMQNYILSHDFYPGYGYWMYSYYNCTLFRLDT